MEVAATCSIDTRETALTRYDLYSADECLITGTGAEIMPVTKIDGRLIRNGVPGPVTKRLIEGFRKFVATQK